MFATLADLLTGSRLISAILFVWLGFRGPDTLGVAVPLGILTWTTDQLDGWAARRTDQPTRLARYDFAIDSTVYAAVLSYMVLVGFLPLFPAAVFAVVIAAWAWSTHSKAPAILGLRTIDLACAVIIFKRAPAWGWALLAWLAVFALVYRRRLVDRVPRWIGELRRLWPPHRRS